MKSQLDITQWNRKDHFHFFKQFEEPFFGVCVEVDCSIAYNKTKENNSSFFLNYLHKSLRAANAIEPFRYRMETDDSISIYDKINASPTINRDDNTFGFSYIEYEPDFKIFEQKAQAEIHRVRANSGLELTASNDNVIHFSSLPWLHFTSLSHARSFSFKDCIPKISFGKIIDINKQKMMPVSIHVHHALMDGYHVGQFVELFQNYLNE